MTRPRSARNLIAATWIALAVTVSVERCHAEGKEDFSAPIPTAEEMQQMQQRWMEACVPGKWHRRLEYFLGKWDTVTQLRMGGMAGEGGRTKGQAEFRWLVDGRWLWMEGKGEMMGQKLSTYGITGYDNFRHKFVSVFVDDISTAMNTAAGLLDQEGNTKIEYGTIDEPMTGEVGKHVKYITRITDDDHFVFEVHDLGIGETNTLVFDVSYTRRK